MVKMLIQMYRREFFFIIVIIILIIQILEDRGLKESGFRLKRLIIVRLLIILGMLVDGMGFIFIILHIMLLLGIMGQV